ncbi:type II toxin-antitoxin system prevent-host-death family antitoxin [Corynebacterium sp. MSK008]|uniref:type II toxin-antitoxin system Phd/YefM family antitoxin n=1 Tax=Corynebacterium sp. MSK008 TaxID=3050188 RepID=UPI0025519CDC|nr:type II toxin-antitoxin system prevent-host-death family antitoxin [Corynebacterium sp. MSK008]MDK8879753.1 type II toxin-antitoxin system prevent-host-death family antitoxin [Corynebacterium sp. MSK008]
MATPEYDESLVERRISQRELRNDSARILREVRAGRSFVVTNNGEPVGRLVPLDEPKPRLTITRPATRVGGWLDLPVKPVEGATLDEMLDDMREDRF